MYLYIRQKKALKQCPMHLIVHEHPPGVHCLSECKHATIGVLCSGQLLQWQRWPDWKIGMIASCRCGFQCASRSFRQHLEETFVERTKERSWPSPSSEPGPMSWTSHSTSQPSTLPEPLTLEAGYSLRIGCRPRRRVGWGRLQHRCCWEREVFGFLHTSRHELYVRTANFQPMPLTQKLLCGGCGTVVLTVLA